MKDIAKTITIVSLRAALAAAALLALLLYAAGCKSSHEATRAETAAATATRSTQTTTTRTDTASLHRALTLDMDGLAVTLTADSLTAADPDGQRLTIHRPAFTLTADKPTLKATADSSQRTTLSAQTADTLAAQATAAVATATRTDLTAVAAPPGQLWLGIALGAALLLATWWLLRKLR